jgi:hypothetical protein
MSTCWACGGAPPSWFCVCEECGGRGQLLERSAPPQGAAEINYWRNSVGQFSNPFRSREHERVFIVLPNPNPLLLRAPVHSGRDAGDAAPT